MPQERISERMVKQCDDLPLPQVVKESLQVVKTAFQGQMTLGEQVELRVLREQHAARLCGAAHHGEGA